MTEDKARKLGRAFQTEGTVGVKAWGCGRTWDALGAVSGPGWRTVSMVDRRSRNCMTPSVGLSYVKPLKVWGCLDGCSMEGWEAHWRPGDSIPDTGLPTPPPQFHPEDP